MSRCKVLKPQNQIKNLVNLLQSPTLKTKQLKQIHLRLLQRNPPLGSSLYICNSILVAYANSTSKPIDACAFFATQMRHLIPNNFTFQFLLKAVSKLRSVTLNTQIHLMVLKLGFTGFITIMNSILHCYVLCGEINAAHVLFDEMPDRDVVSFNCMINGYAELGDMGSALELFQRVRLPTVVTWTAMVVGFSVNEDLTSARRFFEEMPERDLVSWNAMISGYVKNGVCVEALHLFRRMQVDNFRPNTVTISTLLSACANLGALDTGKCMHLFIHKTGFRLDPFLGSALIDMYCKCGVVELALRAFGILEEKNASTWNALINGLAINGRVKQALHVFNQMKADTSVRPDQVTFVGVLQACTHGGLIEEGRNHFYSTMKHYGIPYILEHYACIVDLLGRCGMLKEAQDVIIRDMHIAPDMVIWRALLGGCRIHKNVKLAEWVIHEMKSPASGDYVLMSNLYASVGWWGDMEKVRNIMKEKGIEKTPGCSSIQIDHIIHEFISGDKSHPRYVEICEKLVEVERMMSPAGHLAETSVVLYDVDEEEKERTLGHHSEKLAIGFGLLCTTPKTTLRIVKNLRVCIDCHNTSKMISKIYDREIVVRDRIRFHHFKDGRCSCNDYW